MRTFVFPVLAGLLASTALATVTVQVYRADEQTPLEWADPNVPDVYQDIMVGTRLICFVVSDVNEAMWSGRMHSSWDDWSLGTLAARDYNEISCNYDGSILPASGQETYIYESPSSDGMCLSLGVDTALAGEWIVLDYHAKALGTCHIGLYGLVPGDLPPGYDPRLDDPPPASAGWIQGLSFNHVSTRDFDGDSVVNFTDFALWASQWHGTIAADPNMAMPDPNMAIPGDLNADDAVDVSSLALFCKFWLERTDVPERDCEPNTPDVAR